MPKLGSACFGALTFPVIPTDPVKAYGPNGLPTTPPSVRILGRFQKLKAIQCVNLCKYLDIIRGRYEILFIVSEHYTFSLVNSRSAILRRLSLESFLTSFLAGLQHLHNLGISHRNLSPQNVLLTLEDKEVSVKLANFGLYYMTEYGADVEFLIGTPKYFAPELLLKKRSSSRSASTSRSRSKSGDRKSTVISGPKVDIWAFGLICLEVVLDAELWKGIPNKEVLQRIGQCVKKANQGSAFVPILKDNGRSEKEIPSDIYNVLYTALHVLPSQRPTANALMKVMEMHGGVCVKEPVEFNPSALFGPQARTKDLTILQFRNSLSNASDLPYEFMLRTRPIEEAYFLWKLAGSDVETLMIRKGYVQTQPPILALPNVAGDDGVYFGQNDRRTQPVSLAVVPLSMELIQQRLEGVEAEEYFPVLELNTQIAAEDIANTNAQKGVFASASLPTIIKEKDIEYQLKRQILFQRLLEAYPYKKSFIWKEARVDIPPLYRHYVWAALLDIQGDVEKVYNSIDKETAGSSDRQIEVDIPRCHQYDELLSSPEAHLKFKRILKAWVSRNPQYTYWQGLDSLCAPFLFLNFNHEEYLAIFNHLIAYHDPLLFNHLEDVGFHPELIPVDSYLRPRKRVVVAVRSSMIRITLAIFNNYSSYVFPLHKIFHLWDTLLLGNDSFPFCIGVAVLIQLRDRLLTYRFNECILLFSDLPTIDIEQCVRDAVFLFCNTPKSATVRFHSPPPQPARLRRKTTASFIGYTIDTQTNLGMSPLLLKTLRNETSPRICAAELIDLASVRRKSPYLPSKVHRVNNILTVDIRAKEDFMKGTFPGSINIPISKCRTGDGQKFKLSDSKQVAVLNEAKNNAVIVIMGSKVASAPEFATHLVTLGYPRVCVLHNGVDAFLHTGMLAIPPVKL